MKKILLSKQTLRVLTPAETDDVAGGTASRPVTCITGWAPCVPPPSHQPPCPVSVGGTACPP